MGEWLSEATLGHSPTCPARPLSSLGDQRSRVQISAPRPTKALLTRGFHFLKDLRFVQRATACELCVSRRPRKSLVQADEPIELS